MKQWTQAEYDATHGELTSASVPLGTGDFRKVDFRGRHRLVIGPNSLLGDGAHLGVACELGSGCLVGTGFVMDAFGRIGDRCRFAAGARIGTGTRIGSGCSFAQDAVIEPACVISADVSLPHRCRLYGVPADGTTMMIMAPVDGRTICSFRGERDGDIYVGMPDQPRLIEDMEEFAGALCAVQGIGQAESLSGRRLRAACTFIRTHFSLTA